MNKNLVNIGKLIAFEYLRSLGYVLIDRAYRKSHYYIDFVMKRSDGSIRFVNVDTNSGSNESIDNVKNTKKSNLLRSSQIWLETKDYSSSHFGWDYIG
ncbi:MAG: YraN family protein, partial [bacterium]